MMITLSEVVKSGYVASLYADDRKEEYYWLEVSYKDEKVLFAIKEKYEGQIDELVMMFETIRVNTLEKLLDLKKVKGFSAGRLIRYIQTGSKMDTCFNFFSGTIVATLSIVVLLLFIYTKSNKESLLIMIGLIGVVIAGFFFYLYTFYRHRLKYDK